MVRSSVLRFARKQILVLSTAILLVTLAMSFIVPATAAGPYYISEILMNPPGTDAPHEYIELRGTASATLPTGTYLVGIEGDSSGSGVGIVQTIFNLSGVSFGSNGYLVLRQFNSAHTTVAGANVLTSTAAGWSGGVGFTAESGTDIENPSVTFLLINAATAPAIASDIDSNNDGTPDGAVYSAWTIHDSVSILDSGTTDAGYADIVFVGGAANGLVKPGALKISAGFNAQYIARIGTTTGSTAGDWFASDDLDGTAPNFVTDAVTTTPVAYAGQALNHIGGANPLITNNPPVVFGLPGGVSATNGDPTQPIYTGAGFGLNFSVSDDTTAADAITVMVANGTPGVLSSAAVVDTGVGTWRLDLGAPAGTVGYSNVTVSANDGTTTTNFIVGYAASQDDPGTPNDLYLTGAAEASTALALDADYMLVADDEDQFIRTYSRTVSGAPLTSTNLTSSLGLTDISGSGNIREVDIEGSTRNGATTYWMGSHSHSSSGNLTPNRSRIFAATVSGTGAATTLTYVGRYDNLKVDLLAWDSSNGHGLGASALGLTAAAVVGLPPENGGYNQEGLSFRPGSTSDFFVGFRSPLVAGKAIVVPVDNLPGLTSGNPTTGPAVLETPYLLDLGGRGVRSIECNATECLILAGSPGAAGDFKLFTWVPGSAPVARTAVVTGGSLHPEGIVEVPATFTAASPIQLVSDNGDTIMYNDGEGVGDLDIVNHRKFRADTIALGDAVVPPTPVINEFSASHTGSDNREYVEIFGTPNTDYSAYTLIEIEGDFSGTAVGTVDEVVAIGTTDASGYWWTGFRTDAFENGTVSLLLVQGFSGALTNDLDTNDDGTFDVTPWTAIIDAVAVYDGGATDRAFGGTVLNPNYDGLSTFAPGGASRIPNGADTNAITDWKRNDFDLAGIPGFTGTLIAGEALNTPNAVNATTPPDVAPTVASTAPADDAVNVPVDGNITITFSEPVTVTDPWVTMVCTTSGTVATTISGGPTTYTVNPNVDLFPAETCTVTVTAANVVDQDGTPNAMAANYVFDFGTVGGAVCSTAFTRIYTLQDGGANFGVTTPFTVEGIVTGDFQLDTQLGGFFLQDAAGDGNVATSDALFVADPQPLLLDVTVGQRVRVTGLVSEFIASGSGSVGQTRITATLIVACGDTGTVAATPVTLPFADLTFAERYENMFVTLPQTLYANDTFTLGRYGEVSLSAGSRLVNPTNVVDPGAPAQALQLANNLNTLKLDDGDVDQNVDPTPYLFGADFTLRSGDTVSMIDGILTHSDASPFSTSDLVAYRIHPTETVTFTRSNPRPTAPVNTAEARVISFNVLNYFNGNGAGGGFPTARGANTFIEFQRQSDKIVAAIRQLNPDIAGLIELENDSGASGAQQELVNRLNAAMGAGTYAIVETGVIGTDAIKVGFIYKPAAFTAVGAAMIDTDAVHNRPPVAQTFQHIATGARFVAVVNHFKSKSCTSASGANQDQGDGQGCYNADRLLQAQRLDSWIKTVAIPTSGEPDVLIIGDLNAYHKEDPITTLVNGGFANQLTRFDANAYGYVFAGQYGALDHALATSVMAAQIVSATDWHINGDEPVILDYNMEFKSDAQDALNLGTPFRSSDHDPAVVDLDLATPPAGATPIAPTGTIVSLNPVFTWTQVTGVDFYHFWLSKGANKVLDQWLVAADICNGTICTFPLPFLLTEPGVYAWFVQTFSNIGGYGPWSAETNFTLIVTPATPVPTAPIGDISETNPLFTFNAVPGATNYHVWVSRVAGPDQGYVKDMWLNAADICTAGVCRANLALSLVRGAYGWWVQSYSPFGGYSPWTSRTDFNVVLPLSAAPTPIAPIGATTDTSPTFSFSRIDGATWYYLWLSSGPNKIMDQWYNAADICTTPTLCEVTPGLNLVGGFYSWFIQAYSPYGGYSAWSAETQFTIALAPLNPVQIAPVGSILQTNPTYTWERSAGATFYAIWVSNNAGYVLDRWVAAAVACTGNTCTLNTGVMLANGVHRWWVQAWNPWGGYSLWTGPMVFNVGGPGAGGEPAGVIQPVFIEPVALDGEGSIGSDSILPETESGE